jgi:L,D-transpeptidase YbiS
MSPIEEIGGGPIRPMAERRPRKRHRALWGWLIGVLVVILLAAGLGAGWYATTGFAYVSFPTAIAPELEQKLEAPPAVLKGATRERQLSQLGAERKRFEAALTKNIPRGSYIIIDQAHNRLYVRRGQTQLLEAVCSAGSGMVLQEAGGKNRKWVFDTPRGVFKVLQKTENPVWKKPDWAFLEEGKPIPKDPGERFEYGMLGEYALYFGNGYMIHGTLYERLLGRSVTHGCIRLGRDDLRVVFKECPLGTPIYVY